MYRIEYLPIARQDMVEIARYIGRELCNPEAARKLAGRMVQAAESLTEFPHSKPLYIPPRPLEHEYRKLIVDKYIMFYWVDERKRIVTIARVIYTKRNWEEILAEKNSR